MDEPLSAARRALGIPEICAAVIDQLSPCSLLQAALVCRLWAQPALRILWREAAPGFCQAPLSARRRAFYAPFIRRLSLVELDEHSLADWTFPAARQLELVFVPPVDAAAVATTIIDALARCGPGLETFHLDLELEFEGSELDCRVLYALAQRASLRNLGLSIPLTALVKEDPAMSPEMKALANQQPFAGLQQLEVRLPADQLPMLMDVLTGDGEHVLRLRAIDIMIALRTGQFLQTLAPLRHTLRELLVEAYTDAEWGFLNIGNIRTLQAFSHLRILQIRTALGRDCAETPMQAVEDADILHVVQHMRHLHTLIIDVRCRLSKDLFIELANRCPQLVRLLLPAPLDYDLVRASGRVPLYSLLEDLGLESAGTSRDG